MAAKRKPSAPARQRKTRKPVKRVTRKLAIEEFKELDKWFVYLAKSLARCEPEEPFIYSFMKKLYCTGFASGAVASRKTFTEWKPNKKVTTPIEQLQELIAQFQMEMTVVHAPEIPVSRNN